MTVDLILRRVHTLDHPAPVDVVLSNGRISAIAQRFNGTGDGIDGAGCTLIPGLIDQHMHVMASAAARESLDLTGLTERDAVIAAVRDFSVNLPRGTSLRATGYDERAAGLVTRAELDQWFPDRPMRILDRTGALWMVNSAMAACFNAPLPEGVDLSKGHIWRQDAWLRTQLGGAVPDIAALARELASVGVTGITDTSPHNGPSEAALFETALSDGRWPLRLQLMGREDLPVSFAYHRGPLKLHYDERDLPDLDVVAARIVAARDQRRAVAAHCVSEAELVWFLAALDMAGGAGAGDRVEHGGIIPAALIPRLAEMDLTIVSNPGFIAARGDRYTAQIPAAEWRDLYRLQSLQKANVRLAAGSDAPYGPLDPWAGMRAAMRRLTASGQALGAVEALDGAAALRLYLWDFSLERHRQVTVGASADLCLLTGTPAEVVDTPDAARVRATLVGGQMVYGG